MERDRKVPLVATESFKYGTRQLRPNDPFEATELDAADMRAVGHAHDDVSRETKPLSVKQASKRPAKPVKPKRKYIKSGKYKRRDMRAED